MTGPRFSGPRFSGRITSPDIIFDIIVDIGGQTENFVFPNMRDIGTIRCVALRALVGKDAWLFNTMTVTCGKKSKTFNNSDQIWLETIPKTKEICLEHPWSFFDTWRYGKCTLHRSKSKRELNYLLAPRQIVFVCLLFALFDPPSLEQNKVYLYLEERDSIASINVTLCKEIKCHSPLGNKLYYLLIRRKVNWPWRHSHLVRSHQVSMSPRRGGVRKGERAHSEMRMRLEIWA
eukprot:sb/3469361/